MHINKIFSPFRPAVNGKSRTERRAARKADGKQAPRHKLAGKARKQDIADDFGWDAYLHEHSEEMRLAKAAYEAVKASRDGVAIRAMKGFALAGTAVARTALAAKLADESGVLKVSFQGLRLDMLAMSLMDKSPERHRRIINATKAVAEAVGEEAILTADLEAVYSLAVEAGLKPRRVRDGLIGVKRYRKAMADRPPRKLRVVLLFDGISATSVAAAQLGDRFEIVAVAEIGDHPGAVIAARHPSYPNLGDITKVDWVEFRKQYGEIDLIVAGWPCQDISRANPEQLGLAGERSGLFFELVKIIRILRPKYLLGENVASLFDANMREDLATVLDTLEKAGYRVDCDLLDPTQVGVPMARPRFYGFGVRKDVARQLPKLPFHRHPTADKALKAIGKGKFGGYLSCLRFGAPKNLGSYLVPNPSPDLLYSDEQRGFGLDKWDRKDRVMSERPAMEADHVNAIPKHLSGLPFVVAHGINDTLCWNSQNFGLGGGGMRKNRAYTFTRRTGFGVSYEGCVRKYAIEEVEALFGFPAGYTDVPYVGGKKVRKLKPAGYNVRMAALGNTMEVNCIKHGLEAVLLAEYLAD